MIYSAYNLNKQGDNIQPWPTPFPIWLPVWASLLAQRVKCLPTIQETWVQSWDGKIPWRRKWQPTPVHLPGKSHWRRSLVGCSPWGRKESDKTEQLHFHFHFPYLEPVCCSMSSSKCCILTCIQISQEAVKWSGFPITLRVYHSWLWSTHSSVLLQSGKHKYMFFWNSLAFSMIQQMLAIWSLVLLPFLNAAWTSASSRFTYYWSLHWGILSISVLACEMSAIVR